MVGGLEYAARLYGLGRLRICTAEQFVRELLECDRVSADKFRTFRSHIDPPALLRSLYDGRLKEYNLSGDILLQMAQGLAAESPQRPRVRAMAQKVMPGILRAAEAMLHLRRFMEGD